MLFTHKTKCAFKTSETNFLKFISKSQRHNFKSKTFILRIHAWAKKEKAWEYKNEHSKNFNEYTIRDTSGIPLVKNCIYLRRLYDSMD